MSNISTSGLIKRLYQDYVKDHTGKILIATIFMAIAGSMTAALARLMEPVIDDVFTAGNQDRLFIVASLVLGVFILRGLSTYIHTLIMNWTGLSVLSALQKQLHKHFLGRDLAFFDQTTSGQLSSYLISDVTLLRQTVTDGITGIIKSSITLMCLIAVMFYQDWRLSLAAFIVFPIATWFVIRLGKRLRKVSDHTQNELGSFTSHLTEAFQAPREIKVCNAEQDRQDRANTIIDQLFRLYFKAVRVGMLSTPVTEFLSGVAIVLVIVYGGQQVIDGTKTAGEIFSFIAAFLMAYEPMKRLAKLNNSVQIGMAAANRIFYQLDQKNDIVDLPKAKPFDNKKITITFDKIHFAYGDNKVLNNISMKIKPQTKVALVGPSGSGKTTILNLIPRFYDPTKGKILFNDQDIKKATLHSLRNHIGYVGQNIAMFNDTIRANITFGSDSDTDQNTIEKAAKNAFIHDFIKTLPNGYDTIVGENGVSLSGGQKQRLAIARAMLQDTPILLLDEATSALDTESERYIQKALAKLQKGKTVIVVAHRLSTVSDADEIFVIDQGKIIDHGTHKTLLKKSDLYRMLYTSST